MSCQNKDPELSKTFAVNITSVQLLLKPDDVGGDVSDDVSMRELWFSREDALSLVVIAEHGNARGVIQFNVVRVCSLAPVTSHSSIHQRLSVFTLFLDGQFLKTLSLILNDDSNFNFINLAVFIF